MIHWATPQANSDGIGFSTVHLDSVMSISFLGLGSILLLSAEGSDTMATSEPNSTLGIMPILLTEKC